MANEMLPDGDDEWEAKWDYDALVRAEVVKADDARLKVAKAWGKKVEAEKQAEMDAAEAIQDL